MPSVPATCAGKRKRPTMRLSQYPINTMKETPAEAEVVSHQLMLRAGLIRRLAAGIYSWLPMGLRVLRKVERIIREEMNRAGALELLMPAVQPAELWQESGRWSEYGPELLRLKDRHERDFVVGPTHEEVITDIARRELQELPAAAGELLPDPDQVPRRDPAALRRDARARVHHEGRLLLPRRRGLAGARATRAMYDAYTRIFTRIGLKFRAVRADSGAIGGRRLAGIPGARRLGRGCDRRSPTAMTTRPTSRPRRPLPPAGAAPRARRGAAQGRDAAACAPSPTSRASSKVPRRRAA